MRVTRTTDPNGNVLCAAFFQGRNGTPDAVGFQQSLVHTKMLVRVGVPVHRR